MRAALGERACIVPISYIMPPDLLPDPRTRVRATAEALTRANAHQRHRPVAFTDLCCAPVDRRRHCSAALAAVTAAVCSRLPSGANTLALIAPQWRVSAGGHSKVDVCIGAAEGTAGGDGTALAMRCCTVLCYSLADVLRHILQMMLRSIGPLSGFNFTLYVATPEYGVAQLHALLLDERCRCA